MSSRSRTGKRRRKTRAEKLYAVPSDSKGKERWDADLPVRQLKAIHRKNPRPKTRGRCQIRPCPYVSCRYHLWNDYVSRGCAQDKQKLAAWLARDPTEMKETCSLDVADRGEETLEVIGELFGLTRERIRQIETEGLRKVREELASMGYDERRVKDMFIERVDPDSYWPRPIQVIGQPDDNGYSASCNFSMLWDHCSELTVQTDDDTINAYDEDDEPSTPPGPLLDPAQSTC